MTTDAAHLALVRSKLTRILESNIMSEVLEQELTDVLREIDFILETEEAPIQCIPADVRQ